MSKPVSYYFHLKLNCKGQLIQFATTGILTNEVLDDCENALAKYHHVRIDEATDASEDLEFVLPKLRQYYANSDGSRPFRLTIMSATPSSFDTLIRLVGLQPTLSRVALLCWRICTI
jgi:HrpA-like RNA helicase